MTVLETATSSAVECQDWMTSPSRAQGTYQPYGCSAQLQCNCPISPSLMPDDHDAYDNLTRILHHLPPRVLELDFLPSSSSSQIQFAIAEDNDAAALGIGKGLLIQCFLIARKTLFAHSSRGEHEESCRDEISSQTEQAVWRATSVMLLWDPNHTTAINWRKRFLLRRLRSRDTAHDDQMLSRRQGREFLQQELVFLESLLTSPPPKHTKSPTLWTHRSWVLRTFLPGCCMDADLRGGSKQTDGLVGSHCVEKPERSPKVSWDRELAIVMKAGERHPRNYYAWNFARDIFVSVQAEMVRPACDVQPLAGSSVEGVKKWCFMHPRDISGWVFLLWMLERVDAGSGTGERDGVLKEVVWEIREFVRKYEWRGESVEWFLRTVDALMVSWNAINVDAPK